MEETKIQLSPEELQLMQNSDWILTKNSIIEKINHGFGAMVTTMQEQLKLRLGDSIDVNSPKISRGEKYLGLPYVILDYPRIFGRDDVLAIRTLFWWGQYCSVTLHVKGCWQEMLLSELPALAEELAAGSFYISFSGDEWSHNIFDSDYTKLQQVPTGDIIQKLSRAPFIKLAAKVTLASWSEMEKELNGLFQKLIKLIRN